MTPLEKVRALRRLAASTTFEPEAESARAKALQINPYGSTVRFWVRVG